MLKLAVHCLVVVASQPVVDLVGDETVSLLQTKANKHVAEGAPEAAVMKSLFPLTPPWGDSPVDSDAFKKTQDQGKAILENDKDAFKSMQEEGQAMLSTEVATFQLNQQPTGDVGSGLRFPNVGSVDDNQVDLIISVPDDYKSGKLNKKKVNGLFKGFARIHFQANTTQRMKLSIVKNGTDEPVKVPLLAMNLFSIGTKRRERWPLSVSNCETTKITTTWSGPNLNETDGGCGGKTYTGVSFLRNKDRPKSLDAVEDKHCKAAMALKWWDVSEVTLELSVGEPKKKKAWPFIFKLGLTQCQQGWTDPDLTVKKVSKAELKANKKAEKIRKKKELKAAKKLAKENAKRARKSR